MPRIIKELSFEEFGKRLKEIGEPALKYFVIEGNIITIHVITEKKEHLFAYVSRVFEQFTEEM
jgi:hypothetical protein